MAMRTAPTESYRNIVELVVSVINLGLQSIGIMRTEMGEQLERPFCNANSLADVRKLTQQTPGLKEAIYSSLQSPLEQMTATLNLSKQKR